MNPLRILFFLFVTQIAQAQKFVPARMVTTDADTLRGFVADRTDAEILKRIDFKSNSKDALVISYVPANLTEVAFETGRLFRWIFYMDDGRTVKRFAKRIVEGEIEVYIWDTPASSEPHFILINRETGRSAHLSPPEKKVITTRAGRTLTTTDDRFIRQITYVKGDTAALKHSERQLKYLERSVVNEILSYNEGSIAKYPVTYYSAQGVPYNTIMYGFAPFEPNLKLPYRIAYYRTKIFPEKKHSFSYAYGASYRSWSSIRRRTLRSFSAMVAGFHYQNNRAGLCPFIYSGIGLHQTKYETEDEFIGGLTMFFGAGARMRIGSSFLTAEVSPSSNRVFFLNVGCTF